MASHRIPTYIVNAFTKEPFTGNPAAVCLVDRKTDVIDVMKQSLASEFNLSETAFITPIEPGADFRSAIRFSLRWFTPATEVTLCGHATLASAAVLFDCVGNINKKITFETLSGPLYVEKSKDGKISMVFPSYMPVKLDQEDIAELLKIVVGDLPYQNIKYSPILKKLVIRLKDSVTKAQLESRNPNAEDLLRAHNDGTIRGVILTLRGSLANGSIDDSGHPYDFLSRFFAPWLGIPEDPVTGSAHSILAPYWSAELKKTTLYACQCSKRKGELWIDTSVEGKVIIKGEAFVAIQGSLQLK